MALPQAKDTEASFGLPGGERCEMRRHRPVDLDHLAHQTFGDRALEAEVLSLFVRQASDVAARLYAATSSERVALAHTLKGSARSIGAFGVADLAERIETQPDDRALLKRLVSALDETRDFIAAISR